MNDMNQFNDWDSDTEMRVYFDRYVLPDLGIDSEDSYSIGLAYDSWHDRMEMEAQAEQWEGWDYGGGVDDPRY